MVPLLLRLGNYPRFEVVPCRCVAYVSEEITGLSLPYLSGHLDVLNWTGTLLIAIVLSPIGKSRLIAVIDDDGHLSGKSISNPGELSKIGT